MNEESKITKKGSNKKFIFVVIFLVLVVLGLISYIVYDKGIVQFRESSDVLEKSEKNSKSSKKDTTSSRNDVEENEQKSSESSSFRLLKFDSSKCINNPSGNYTISVFGDNLASIGATVDNTKRTVSFSYNIYRVSQTYPLGWVSSIENITTENFPISFAQEVEDVFFGALGQSSTGDTMLFLMEDGSVEYIPIMKVLSTSPKSPHSYGKLPDVSGVVKFYTANTAGGVTILAQKADGTFYDLGPILRNTGNY